MEQKKKNKTGIAAVIATFFALLTYALTADLLITAMLAVVGAVAVYRFLMPAFALVQKRLRNIQDAHQIIHAMTVDLTGKQTVWQAFTRLAEYLPPHLLVIYERQGDPYAGFKEVVEYLQVRQLQVFIKTLHLYETQGGDPAKLNQLLLASIDHLQLKSMKLVQIKGRKMREIAIMWGLVVLILLYMRFGLSEFYLASLTSFIFRYAIGLTLAIMVGAFILLAKSYQRMELEGAKQ